MKRRDFLKILGTAPAVLAVPALAKTDIVSRQLSDAKTLQSYPQGNSLDPDFFKKFAEEITKNLNMRRMMK